MAWINLLPLGAIPMVVALHRLAPAGFRLLAQKLLYIYLLPVPFFAAAWFFAGPGLELRFGLSLAAVAVSLALLGRRFGAGFIAFFRAKDRVADAPPD